MNKTFMVPKLLCGDYRTVKKNIFACVKQAKIPQDMILRLQEDLIPAEQVEGIFIIEAQAASEQKKRCNYWCDAVMIELDRRFDDVTEMRNWSYELLNFSWGGLTFLSQESNGVVRSQDFCRDYAKWMLCYADDLEEIGERFSLTGRRDPIKIWNEPTNLAGALGILGATNQDFSNPSALAFVNLAKKLLERADLGS